MKYVFLVCTEYHLFLTLNFINELQNADATCTIIVRRNSKGGRIAYSNLNLTELPYKFIDWKHDFNPKTRGSQELDNDLDTLLALKPDCFCFFQEQDMLSAFLLNKLSAKENFLFQDGMKAYNKLKIIPLSLLLNEFKIQKWLYKNYKITDDTFNLFKSHRYGFRKKITHLYLTFPDNYVNWSNKIINKSVISYEVKFLNKLKEVFGWNNDLLINQENIIFYLNQPCSFDSDIENQVLRDILLKFPNKIMYIKIHPNTTRVQIDGYNKLNNVIIIESKVPAELFILSLSNSIILSISSSALFVNNNNNNNYYYLRPMFVKYSKRLKKYITSSPSDHIKDISSIQDIWKY